MNTLNDIYVKQVNKLISKLKGKKATPTSIEATMNTVKQLLGYTSLTEAEKQSFYNQIESTVPVVATVKESKLNKFFGEDLEAEIEADPELNAEPELTDVKSIDATNVTVGETTRNVKVPMKNKKKFVRNAIIGAAAILGISGVAVGLNSCSKPKSVQEQTIDTEDNNKKKNIKPTLEFDAEDKDVIMTNMEAFIKDSLPKGIELTDAELESQIESLINYYVWLNLDEIGPDFLSKLYQSDSISYMEIFSDSMYWANNIRFDSITSSLTDNTVLNVDTLIASKADRSLVKQFLNINAELRDAVVANNKESISTIVSNYRTLIETTLLDHKSYSYGQGSMDLCFRLIYSGEQLLQDYDEVIMTDDLANIVNQDEFLECVQKMSYSTMDTSSMTNQELEVTYSENTSKKSDNVIYAVDILKDYVSRMNLNQDFTNEISVADMMYDISKYVRDNNLLSTYKANVNLDEFFLNLYNQTHVMSESTLQAGDVLTGDGYYVPASEMAKYGATTIEEYEEAVEDAYKGSTEFTDTEGNTLATGSEEEVYDYVSEYVKGYEAGSYQGTIDGNALASKNPSTSGNDAYKNGYAVGYNSSYDDAYNFRKQNDAAGNNKQESTTTDTKVEYIEEGTYPQPENQVEEPTTVPVEPPAQTETTKPSISTSTETTTDGNGTTTTTTTTVEEEVIDEGILDYSLMNSNLSTLSETDQVRVYNQVAEEYLNDLLNQVIEENQKVLIK